jgi:hypothetical protein
MNIRKCWDGGGAGVRKIIGFIEYDLSNSFALCHIT